MVRIPLVLAVALAVLPACGTKKGDYDASASLRSGEKAGATVVVRNLDYVPHAVTVEAGQVVVWRFDDGAVPHNVKGSDFRSPVVKHDTWSRRFSAPGTYDYLCTIHTYMRGTVTVR